MIEMGECTGDLSVIVSAAVAGDRDAFGTLYRRYWPNVRSYIGRRILDRGTAEDLTQDVFGRAFLAMRRYEERGADFGAFVVTIARNIVADYFKSAKTRAASSLIFDYGQLAEAVDVDRWVNPEYCAVHGSEVAALTEALSRLTEDQRMCVELRFLQGLSSLETAVALGKNEGAIKALLHRATSALRRDPALEALR